MIQYLESISMEMKKRHYSFSKLISLPISGGMSPEK